VKAVPDLAQQRCLNHPLREAAACCPECKRYFCRECVTDHEDRAICASCLKNSSRTTASKRSRLIRWFASAGGITSGLLVTWFFFYVVGRNLIDAPDSFHEGTVWKTTLMDGP